MWGPKAFRLGMSLLELDFFVLGRPFGCALSGEYPFFGGGSACLSLSQAREPWIPFEPSLKNGFRTPTMGGKTPNIPLEPTNEVIHSTCPVLLRSSGCGREVRSENSPADVLVRAIFLVNLSIAVGKQLSLMGQPG